MHFSFQWIKFQTDSLENKDTYEKKKTASQGNNGNDDNHSNQSIQIAQFESDSQKKVVAHSNKLMSQMI